MTHDIHQSGVVLDDNCEDCRFKAEHINTLDRPTLEWLVKVSEEGHFGRRPTQAETRAQSLFWHALLVMERLTGRDWRDVIGRDVLARSVRNG